MSFLKIYEKYTFQSVILESVILESVKIESVRVNRHHPLYGNSRAQKIDTYILASFESNISQLGYL